jgi:hypothetical protein
MIELLTSKKFKLPTLFFITDKKDIKDLAVGLPFIYGAPTDKKYFIQLLEWEVLYKRALQTGLPFNWEKILKDNGYNLVMVLKAILYFLIIKNQKQIMIKL